MKRIGKTGFLVLGLLLGFSLGYFLPSVPFLRSKAASSIGFNGLNIVTDNSRFIFVEGTSSSGLFALRESVRVSHDEETGGENGTVAVDALDSSLKRLWRFEGQGQYGEVQGDLYKISNLGCCDAPSTYTYFSLRDGRKLYSSHISNDLLEILLPSRYYPKYGTADMIDRYVSYREDASYDSKGNANGLVGVLQFGSASNIIREVEIRTDLKEFVSLPEGMTIFYNNKRYSYSGGRPIEPWRIPGAVDKNSPTPADFVVSLLFTDGTELKLPIQNDEINLKNVEAPDRFTIKAR